MMKTFLFLLITMISFSCKNISSTTSEEDSHMKLHKEMDKVDEEYEKFQKLLLNYYNASQTNPNLIISKIDSLLLGNKNEKNKYKSQLKETIEDQLHYFKAEIYYYDNQYEKSIKELDFDDKYNFIMGDRACAYAANYLKLKKFDKAKSFVDSIRKSYYIYDYALANYNESIGNKKEAFKLYSDIKNDKTIKHYAYYKLAVNRFEELEKENSKLLNEIYFPTGNPNFEIAESDNENRIKIFDLMKKLPENQNMVESRIVESPQINDKNYYWIRVKTEQKKSYNYYIYRETFEIKFLDTIKNKLITLEDWRKQK
jgi:hypothetical protein